MSDAEWEEDAATDLPTSFGGNNFDNNQSRRFGGGPKTCHKCKEEGHISRDCPSAASGGGGGGGSKSCFKCHEEGHFSRECPQAGGEGGSDDRTCRKCNETGHIQRDCPTGGGSGCYKCGEEGHMARDCTNEAKDSDGKERPPIYVPEELDDSKLFDFGISSGINFDAHDNIPVKVTSNDPVPDKVESFAALGLRELLQQNIAKAGYTRPTPIQKTALPILMAGHDVMGCAQTGSGKTAAFLLPILQFILENNCESFAFDEKAQPTAVIVAPTRELAIQIHQEAKKFSMGSIVKAHLLYGGTSTSHQASRLQTGCHILVATPGRLIDFMEKGKVSFDSLHFLVLDEADRMLDMGFRTDMDKMVDHKSMPARGERKTLMFSATFSKEIQELALKYLHNYTYIVVGMVGAANTDVHQTILQVEGCKKRQTLVNHIADILKMSEDEKILVFVERKKIADFLASFLCTNEKLRVTSIHGDRYQSQREEALATFRSGLYNILIATAVAARGLDIRGIGYVINYDLPKEVDEYVHRIGRTGRVGNLGRAISFFDEEKDAPIAKDLVKILNDAGQVVDEWLMTAAHSSGYAQTFTSGGFASADIRQGVMQGGDIGGPTPPVDDDEDWG